MPRTADSRTVSHVCAVVGCGQLQPCPTHGRKPSDPWSRNRLDDRGERAKWRPIVLDRDGHRCRWCGATQQLEVHHLRGTAMIRTSDDLVTLCRDCNRRAG